MKSSIKIFLVSALTASIGMILAAQAAAGSFDLVYSFPSLTTGLENSYGYSLYSGVILADDTLYGTAFSGGPTSNGTVYAVNTSGTGIRLVHGFDGFNYADGFPANSNGAAPMAGLILSGSTLYGTAELGGKGGSGTVFSVNTNGEDFMTLYAFTNGSDGGVPIGGLVLSDGVLYGTASSGGDGGSGTVFAVNIDGTGFQPLYSFTGGDDGGVPVGGLVLLDGVLYGTASEGGKANNGTVFSVKTDGMDFTPLHSFSALINGTNDDGVGPLSGLILSGNTLYGTATGGGSSGFGEIFSYTIGGSGFAPLYSFPTLEPYGTNKAGADPYGGLALAGSTLYGTAYDGGDYIGTVFSVSTSGTGFQTLYVFPNNQVDGSNPAGNLFISDNTVYGTTRLGGGLGVGGGTIFSIPLGGAVSPPPKTVTYVIAAEATPAHSGEVTGSGIYQSGSSVTLAATSTNGCYQFSKWTIAGKTVGTVSELTFVPTASEQVVANFIQLEDVILTASLPTDGGTVSGGGTKGCGTTVTLTATAKTGFKFVGWDYNGVPDGTKSPLTFEVNGGATVTANFVDDVPPKVTITSPASGSKSILANITVSGTTQDSVGITGVYYQVDSKGGWTQASTSDNCAKWTAPVPLSLGANVVAVYAKDANGNTNTPVTVKISYALP